jgi:hypothetical protein
MANARRSRTSEGVKTMSKIELKPGVLCEVVGAGDPSLGSFVVIERAATDEEVCKEAGAGTVDKCALGSAWKLDREIPRLFFFVERVASPIGVVRRFRSAVGMSRYRRGCTLKPIADPDAVKDEPVEIRKGVEQPFRAVDLAGAR